MKLGIETASVQNWMMSGTVGAPEPEVGMGATILMWTDRHAAQVVPVHPRQRARLEGGLPVMKPLTPKMLAVLKALAEKGCLAHYMGYMGRFNPNAYYFITTSHEKCTREIRGLVDRGLAELFDENKLGSDHKVRISKAGLKFLKEKS